MVKIKAIEYDNKKWIRDHLTWDRLLDVFDFQESTIPYQAREQLLVRRPNSPYVREVLDKRIQWISEAAEVSAREMLAMLTPVIDAATEAKETMLESGTDVSKAMAMTMRRVSPVVKQLVASDEGQELGLPFKTAMGIVRSAVSGKSTVSAQVKEQVISSLREQLKKETSKRGKCAYWETPNS